MSCCACLVKTFAWTLLLVAITYIGVKTWMAQKSYIFDADTLKAVTEEALEKSKGEITEIVTVDRVSCRPWFCSSVLSLSQLFLNGRSGWPLIARCSQTWYRFICGGFFEVSYVCSPSPYLTGILMTHWWVGVAVLKQWLHLCGHIFTTYAADARAVMVPWTKAINVLQFSTAKELHFNFLYLRSSWTCLNQKPTAKSINSFIKQQI